MPPPPCGILAMPWGLGAASVYNAFGDKRTLFTQCLDRYLDANMRARIARVEKTLPPRQAIDNLPDRDR